MILDNVFLRQYLFAFVNNIEIRVLVIFADYMDINVLVVFADEKIVNFIVVIPSFHFFQQTLLFGLEELFIFIQASHYNARTDAVSPL